MPRALQVWRAATVPSNMLEHVENLKEAALDKSRPGARSLVPEQGEEAYARGLSEAERFRRLAPPPQCWLFFGAAGANFIHNTLTTVRNVRTYLHLGVRCVQVEHSS